MFTTNAHVTDYVFLLARTDPDERSTTGLTTFLVPLDQPGFEAQAVYTLSGERTNITFYSDLLHRRPLAHQRGRRRLAVADAGAPGRALGARSARTSTALLERGRGVGGRAGDADGAAPIERRRRARCASARAATDLEVAQLLERRTTWMESDRRGARGRGPDEQAVQHRGASSAAPRTLTALVGPDALRSRLDPTAARAAAASSTSCASRSAPRSTPAPARSSATSSPSTAAGSLADDGREHVTAKGHAAVCHEGCRIR